LDLATKAEWLLFAQIPLGVNLFRLPKLTPEEWITRFGKLLGKHVLTMLNGSQYLITTNLNGSTTAQAMVGSNDLGKVS
jgi:lauroyl/myristoyl acyltransferase